MTYLIGSLVLRVSGWELVAADGELPPKFVLIAAPHTSNWDLVYMLAAAWKMRLRVSWVGKHTLFRPPWGGFMRALGGIPIDRRARHNVVATMVEHFQKVDRLILAVPPEGTRKKVEYWKSGFYHIAHGADVPLALAFLDYGKKRCGIGPLVRLTGDVQADMDMIRSHYEGVLGKYPEMQGAPRLREEEESRPVAAMVNGRS